MVHLVLLNIMQFIKKQIYMSIVLEFLTYMLNIYLKKVT